MNTWLPYLLQTNDSQFPNGSYAHSFGLEEMVSLGMIRDAHDLEFFLTSEVQEILIRQELPYVRFSYEAVAQEDFESICQIDREIDSWRLAEEARQASIALGNHRLQILSKLYPCRFLNELLALQKNNKMYAHQITTLAAQGYICQMPLLAVLWSYVYQCYASYVAAALKLLRMGQEKCQKILTKCLDLGNEVIEQSLKVEYSEAGTSIPILDIAASRHATAFSRLFIS